jgi:AraC-like DNA-binding protein
MITRNTPHKIDLTDRKRLQTLLESRRIFNLENCELSIFECYQQSYQLPLIFPDLMITSMIRGKKVIQLSDKPAFDYLPGETVIAAANESMLVDFPDATEQHPAQCTALALDSKYLDKTVDYLNEFYNTAEDERYNWKLGFNQYHFENDNEITELINKLIRICTSNDPGKNIYADLSLKELLIRLIQSQHLADIQQHPENINGSRLHFVLNYITENLTEKIAINALCRKAYVSRNSFFKIFKEQLGISPLDYINRERLKLAKQLLVSQNLPIREVALQCGFNDPNYFVRIFRKSEGITPSMYRSACRSLTVEK